MRSEKTNPQSGGDQGFNADALNTLLNVAAIGGRRSLSGISCMLSDKDNGTSVEAALREKIETALTTDDEKAARIAGTAIQALEGTDFGGATRQLLVRVVNISEGFLKGSALSALLEKNDAMSVMPLADQLSDDVDINGRVKLQIVAALCQFGSTPDVEAKLREFTLAHLDMEHVVSRSPGNVTSLARFFEPSQAIEKLYSYIAKRSPNGDNFNSRECLAWEALRHCGDLTPWLQKLAKSYAREKNYYKADSKDKLDENVPHAAAVTLAPYAANQHVTNAFIRRYGDAKGFEGEIVKSTINKITAENPAAAFAVEVTKAEMAMLPHLKEQLPRLNAPAILSYGYRFSWFRNALDRVARSGDTTLMEEAALAITTKGACDSTFLKQFIAKVNDTLESKEEDEGPPTEIVRKVRDSFRGIRKNWKERGLDPHQYKDLGRFASTKDDLLEIAERGEGWYQDGAFEELTNYKLTEDEYQRLVAASEKELFVQDQVRFFVHRMDSPSVKAYLIRLFLGETENRTDYGDTEKVLLAGLAGRFSDPDVKVAFLTKCGGKKWKWDNREAQILADRMDDAEVRDLCATLLQNGRAYGSAWDLDEPVHRMAENAYGYLGKETDVKNLMSGLFAYMNNDIGKEATAKTREAIRQAIINELQDHESPVYHETFARTARGHCVYRLRAINLLKHGALDVDDAETLLKTLAYVGPEVDYLGKDWGNGCFLYCGFDEGIKEQSLPAYRELQTAALRLVNSDDGKVASFAGTLLERALSEEELVVAASS